MSVPERLSTFNEQAHINTARILRETAGAGISRPEHVNTITVRGGSAPGVGFSVPARTVTINPYQGNNEAERLILLVLYYTLSLDMALGGRRYIELFVGFILNLAPRQDLTDLQTRLATAGYRLIVDHLPDGAMPAIIERLRRIYIAIGCEVPDDVFVIDEGEEQGDGEEDGEERGAGGYGDLDDEEEDAGDDDRGDAPAPKAKAAVRPRRRFDAPEEETGPDQPDNAFTLGGEYQFEDNEPDFQPNDPDDALVFAVVFSRVFATQCNVYLGMPLEAFRVMGERFTTLLFAMLVMSDSKASDTSTNYRTYMARRKRAFVGAAGSNIGRNPFRDLECPSFEFAKHLQPFEQANVPLRRVIVELLNQVVLQATLIPSRHIATEVVRYLKFSGMLAVQIIRETVLTTCPDLLMSPLLRSESLSLCRGLELTEGISYAKGTGGQSFPFASYLMEPGTFHLSWRNLDLLAEIALRAKVVISPRFANVLSRTFPEGDNSIARTATTKLFVETHVSVLLNRMGAVRPPGVIGQVPDEVEAAEREAVQEMMAMAAPSQAA